MKVNVIYPQPCGQLAELPDGSVHTVVTSPPFNLSYRPQRDKKFNIDGYGKACRDRLPEPEYQESQVAVLDALGRVLAPDGSAFYNHKDRMVAGRTISPHEWLSRVKGLVLYQTITIDRGSSHNVDPVRLPPTTEYIFWLCKPGCRPRFNKSCRRCPSSAVPARGAAEVHDDVGTPSGRSCSRPLHGQWHNGGGGNHPGQAVCRLRDQPRLRGPG